MSGVRSSPQTGKDDIYGTAGMTGYRIRAGAFGSTGVHPPLVFAGQRIGIMGGSFNPPHDGHRIVAETAVKRLQLDQLWWVVTPGNPLKANGALPTQAARMQACAAFARGPKMKITGFEAELGTPFTAATLAFLKTRYRGVHFVWVMAPTILQASSTGSIGARSQRRCRLPSSTGPNGVSGHWRVKRLK